MAEPASRQQLKEYCLRNLGAPVIDINVDDSQLEDRIDDALQFFAEYHFDGVEKAYEKYKPNSTDISNGYVDSDAIDPNIISVVRVFQFSDETVNMFDVRYQMALNDYFGLNAGSMNLAQYDITRRYMSLIQQMLSPEKQMRFTRVTNRIHIDMDWDEELDGTDFLVFEVYKKIDPDVYTEIYNDRLLKEYLTALFKKHWGANLSKFEGVQLPGGVTLNGGQIFQQAFEDVRRIEEEVQVKYEPPPQFFVG